MSALALVLAQLLAALPFPAPRLAPVSDRLKHDAGTVISADTARGELHVRCAAGLVTFRVNAEVQLLDAAGRPAGAPLGLLPGQRVRLWYVVDGGARALELALD